MTPNASLNLQAGSQRKLSSKLGRAFEYEAQKHLLKKSDQQFIDKTNDVIKSIHDMDFSLFIHHSYTSLFLFVQATLSRPVLYRCSV